MASEGKGLRQDPVANIAEAVRRHYVDLHPEQILKVQLKSDEIEQALTALEVNQQIHVAIVAVAGTDYRAEHTDIVSAVQLREPEDPGPLFPPQSVQRHHGLMLIFPPRLPGLQGTSSAGA
jgi:hypothetical protein